MITLTNIKSLSEAAQYDFEDDIAPGIGLEDFGNFNESVFLCNTETLNEGVGAAIWSRIKAGFKAIIRFFKTLITKIKTFITGLLKNSKDKASGVVDESGMVNVFLADASYKDVISNKWFIDDAIFKVMVLGTGRDWYPTLLLKMHSYLFDDFFLQRFEQVEIRKEPDVGISPSFDPLDIAAKKHIELAERFSNISVDYNDETVLGDLNLVKIGNNWYPKGFMVKQYPADQLSSKKDEILEACKKTNSVIDTWSKLQIKTCEARIKDVSALSDRIREYENYDNELYAKVFKSQIACINKYLGIMNKMISLHASAYKKLVEHNNAVIAMCS